MKHYTSLLLANTERDVPQLQSEATARAEIGLEVELLDQHTLNTHFKMNRPGAILSRLSLQLDPLKFTNQILKAAEKHRCRVYSHTKLRPLPGSHTAFTCVDGQHHRIESNHVVWASGYETPEQFPAIRRLSKLTSTFVLAIHPLPPDRIWPQRALIWDTDDPYLYARTTSDNRIIIGGGDEPFANPTLRDELIPAKTRQLLRKFNSIFPLRNVEVETAWAGTFAHTEDQLPYVGVMDEFPCCYFALGYGGNGITLSLVAAQIIRDAILGRKNPVARLFSFTRAVQPPATSA